MRVATWNINGLRARLDYLRLWLAARKPDVVGLQEIKITDEEFPTEFFTDLGYHVATYGQKAWNGVAVLSRNPAAGARPRIARRGCVRFATAARESRRPAVHDGVLPERQGPRPRRFPEQTRVVRFAAALLVGAGSAASPVLCGDFNVVPSDLDSWIEGDTSELIFHTKAERDRYAALLELGLVDLFRRHYPDKKTFSWWDFRGGAFHKGQGLRIDMVLATAPVAQRVKDVVIDRDYRKKVEGFISSDHAPVFADLE